MMYQIDSYKKMQEKYIPVINNILYEELLTNSEPISRFTGDLLNYDLSTINTEIGTHNWLNYFCNEAVNVIQDDIISAPSTKSSMKPAEFLLTFLLSKRIKIPETQSIMEYIEQFPDILDVMFNACILAKESFDDSVQFSLEIYKDQESDDRYPTLYIRRKSYDDDILKLIDDISEEVGSKLESKAGWFLVTTDFALPR
ncbi:MAG: hypothetical protein KA113_07505 [Syntrophaceae bacterium]|nr:hypothetical protein [Syntrophaceae bacterium]